jgi:cytoskeletal protein RodZ
MTDYLSELKRVRKSKKLSLGHVANALRISELYLRAIEEKDYSKLPESVYAVGFIRNYAIFLGLDCDGAVMQFKQRDYISDNALFDQAEGQGSDSSDDECASLEKHVRRLISLRLSADRFSYYNISCAMVIVVILAILIALL